MTTLLWLIYWGLTKMGEILQTTSKLYSFETKRFMFAFKCSWISNWQIISIVSISRCYMIAKHASVWSIEEKLLAVPYHSSMLLINITSIQINSQQFNVTEAFKTRKHHSKFHWQLSHWISFEGFKTALIWIVKVCFVHSDEILIETVKFTVLPFKSPVIWCFDMAIQSC